MYKDVIYIITMQWKVEGKEIFRSTVLMNP